MKILSNYDFIIKLLSNFLRDLSNRVHLRVLVNLLIKLLTDTFFLDGHLKIGPFTKILSVNNFVNKLANNL